MTILDTPAIKIGSEVVVLSTDGSGTPSRQFTGIWTVEKINPRTYALTQGTSRLRCDRFLTMLASTAPASATVVTNARTLPHAPAGSFVRFIGGGDKIAKGTILVVLQDKIDKVNCTLIGGDNDRYWRLYPRSLESVTLQDVTDFLNR